MYKLLIPLPYENTVLILLIWCEAVMLYKVRMLAYSWHSFVAKSENEFL